MTFSWYLRLGATLGGKSCDNNGVSSSGLLSMSPLRSSIAFVGAILEQMPSQTTKRVFRKRQRSRQKKENWISQGSLNKYKSALKPESRRSPGAVPRVVYWCQSFQERKVDEGYASVASLASRRPSTVIRRNWTLVADRPSWPVPMATLNQRQMRVRLPVERHRDSPTI